MMFLGTSGTVIDTENRTSTGVLAGTRHVLFSTEPSTKALEEARESQTESTFMTKTSNTSTSEAGDLHDNLVWNLI